MLLLKVMLRRRKFMNLLYLACFACVHRPERSRSNQHSTNGIGNSSPASFRVTVSNVSIDSSVLGPVLSPQRDQLRLILCQFCRRLIARDRLISISSPIPVFIKSARPSFSCFRVTLTFWIYFLLSKSSR